MPKPKTGRRVDRVIKWALENWFQLGWAIFGLTVLYLLWGISQDIDLITIKFWNAVNWFEGWAEKGGVIT